MEMGLSFDDVLLRPKMSLLKSRGEVDLSTRFSRNVKLKIPISSSPMDSVTGKPLALALADLGGIGIIHRFQPAERQYEDVMSVHKSGRLVGAALGISDEFIGLAKSLDRAGVPVLVVDVANGYSQSALNFFTRLREEVRCDIVMGSIATSDAAHVYCSARADGLRVGIGNGSQCSTRVMTGVGIPQLTAVSECSEAANASDTPVVADGGIRNSGHIVKALAFGAASVMSGYLFAGCDESGDGLHGGEEVVYRGMASRAAMLEANKTIKSVEGVQTRLQRTGPAAKIVEEILWNIKSAFTYLNSFNVRDLKNNSAAIQISSAGWQESLPMASHD